MSLTRSPLTQILLNNINTLCSDNIYRLKKTIAGSIGYLPKDSELLAAYRSLLSKGQLKQNRQLEKLLTTRTVRSESGVTPFAVMTKAYICPGQCTFCPLEHGMPKSYLSDEPAAARARALNFDPVRQINSRLKQLEATGHHTDKIELIVIGGTFSNYLESYKREFFKAMIDTINNKVSRSLNEAQGYNETAARRIVGLRRDLKIQLSSQVSTLPELRHNSRYRGPGAAANSAGRLSDHSLSSSPRVRE